MKVGAVIVMYHPDIEQVNLLIKNVSQYVDIISLVDNSAQRAPVELPDADIHYHHFKHNKGIAAAQNVGLGDLLEAQCHYALLLDQDSEVPDTMVNELIAKFDVTDHNLIAIGPRIVCSFTESELRPLVQKEHASDGNISVVSQIISSGMMISLNKLADVGLKEEGLFIDGVDHEWCWRARLQSYQIAIANDIKMRHTMGEHRGRFLGVSYKVGVPIRLYYQFRNILILSRRPYVPLYWKIRNLSVLPLRIIVNGLVEKDKKSRIKYMWQGICDGILNRIGNHDNWH